MNHSPPTSADAPVLASRLTVPQLPEAFIDRPRLCRALDAGTGSPVTLVAAPAGWGKTVLLSSWTRAAGRPVAWLSLEPGDDGHFWSYLRASLGAALAADGPTGGAAGGGAWALPGTAGGAFPARLAETLSRLPEPLVLVLDNFDHLRDPSVLGGVEFLVRHAGSRLRLVIGARGQPPLRLHRWRLSGELTELLTAGLAFTVAETVELLARHGLAPPETCAAGLAQETEGWPAGLRLACLSMREHPDPAHRNGFSGGDNRAVGDYLAHEVLAAQPAHVRDAMVSTSILEWVNGDLMDSLTGRTDGERVLSDLAHANAFVIARDTRPPSYRYHRTFSEFLRGELRCRGAAAGAELHRRAAGWLAANDLPELALSHALAAADWAGATGLLASHWPEVVGRDHHRSGPPAPAPPAAALGADPELALAYAAECLGHQEPGTAGAYLRLAAGGEQALTGDRRERFAAISAALRLARARRVGGPDRVRRAAMQLLDLADCGRAGPGSPAAARAIALARLGWEQVVTGELDAAEASLAAGRTGAAEVGLRCLPATCSAGIALLHALCGRLGAAQRTARDAFNQPRCPGQLESIHCAPAYLAYAIVDIHQDRLSEAGSHLELAASLCDPAAEPELAATIATVRARWHREQGALAAADAALLAARRQPLSPYQRRRLTVAEAEVRVAAGEPAAGRELLVPLLPEAGPEETDLPVALARAHLGDGAVDGAASALPAWADHRAGGADLADRVDAGLLDALAADARGDRRRRTWAVERVLDLAEPEGFRRAFTGAGPAVRELLVAHLDAGTAHWSLVDDLVTTGLTAPRPPATPIPMLDEPLTDRELTVLRYLQSTLSAGEIAREMHLSINTVKTHLRHLYRKLGTTRRREAVRRARELRLL